MNSNMTHRAMSILERSMREARENGNSFLEPEHIIKVTLQEVTSILYNVLNDNERRALFDLMIQEISKFPKQTPVSDNLSRRTEQLLNSAIQIQKDAKDAYLSVDHIVLAALHDRKIVENIEKVLKVDELRTRIGKKTKKIDTRHSDDASEALGNFAVDMVEEARKGKYDPVIGRVEEIHTIFEILAKKKKANPILVGHPGVGKTAIVCGLAQMIADGKAPWLKNYKIYNVDIGGIVANSGIMGEFEGKLKKVIKEAEESPNVILFIDEIHMVLSAGGGAKGSLDAANLLKPSLSSGSIKCIGATTFEEYRQYIEKDLAFERRFVQVVVNEPTIEDSITMLRGLRERFEAHHGTKIMDSAIVFAVSTAKKRIPNRRLPDVAIDVIDTACASTIISLESEPQEILNQKNKIWSVELEELALKLDLKRNPDKKTEERLRDVQNHLVNLRSELIALENQHQKEKSYVFECRKLKKKIEDLNIKLAEAERQRDHYQVLDITNNIMPIYEEKLKKLESEREVAEIITPTHIAEIISRWTGIPVKRLTLKENERLLKMKERIKSRLFGQDQAVDAVVESIWRSRVGLNDADKPIGTFLFLGPSGVGKTELAKSISFELFDDTKKMVVLDMSDYSNETSTTKLIGVSAGYIGYGEGGTLTEPIRNKPYNVVLLDEIDHAHPTVRNILYQLLDEGRITDGKRNVVDFTNTVIIMTSNIGQDEILDDNNYQNGELILEARLSIERKLIQEFGAALINRIGRIAYFNRLTDNVLESIFDNHLKTLNKRFESKNLILSVDNSVKQEIIMSSTDYKYGARPLKRNMEEIFTGAVTEIVLNNDFKDKVSIFVNMNNGVKIGKFFYDVKEVKLFN
ncbi:Chaperone protein ClpB1 [Dictyocoela muelleri]|nr:Chaperone protein ClpB1 [Dictyocoela muelleri]